MVEIPKNVDWVGRLIPNLADQKDQFVVDTDELDDELIEVFIEEILRLTGELQQGMDGNDPELVKQAAHSIKGMGGTIGLPEISVLALEIENAAKQTNLVRCKELSDGLITWVDASFK